VLSALLEERRSLRERLEAVQEGVDWARFDRATREEHEELQVRVAALVEKAREVEQPWLVAVAGKLGDPLLREEWAGCLEDVTLARRDAIELRQALLTSDVEVPEADPQLLEGLTDAAQRLRTRGKLGIWAGNAKSAVERCKVNGHRPRRPTRSRCVSGHWTWPPRVAGSRAAGTAKPTSAQVPS
jgi:hypothetical protein